MATMVTDLMRGFGLHGRTRKEKEKGPGLVEPGPVKVLAMDQGMLNQNEALTPSATATPRSCIER